MENLDKLTSAGLPVFDMNLENLDRKDWCARLLLFLFSFFLFFLLYLLLLPQTTRAELTSIPGRRQPLARARHGHQR